MIEFTPIEAGTYTYTCWMGMIRGNITVTDTLETSPVQTPEATSGIQAFPGDPDTETDADTENDPFFNGSGMGCCGGC